jgi:protein phosphatase
MSVARVSYLRLPQERRVIAVSDIHGNLPLFRHLLEKLRFSEDDLLLILGDLVEKGEQSLQTLRYVMQLQKTHHVHCLLGNCDGWFLESGPHAPRPEAAVRRYIVRYKPGRGPGLLAQMCLAAGIALTEDLDITAMRARLEDMFHEELDYIRRQPHIIETEHFTFVHGGLADDGPLEEQDAGRCMKNDAFLTQGRSFKKWQIVGHWPVMQYREDICDADPLIERERRIVSIDGGCVLHRAGQLNALLLPSDENGDFQNVRCDGFPVYRALDRQAASADPFHMRWGDSAVELLERGPKLSRCRHLRTGREMEVFTKFLRETDGRFTCDGATDYVLPVEPGDELSLMEESAHGALVKRGGVFGWYRGRLGAL